MKKFLAVFLAACMMLSLLVVPAIADESATGTTDTTVGYQAVTPTVTSGTNLADNGLVDGTTTYIINSEAGMDKLAELVTGGNTLSGYTFYLTADISGTQYDPLTFKIGIKDNTNPTAFSGTFDGQGYMIDYWQPTFATSNGVGMFGNLNGGTVKNLQIGEHCKLAPSSVIASANYGCALIAYAANAFTVSNINSAMTIETVEGSYKVGGIVGGHQGSGVATITNCTVSGSISGATYVGGILAYEDAGGVDGVAISNCVITNKATISGTTYVGGIFGYKNSTRTNAKLTISNCVNNGAVSVGSTGTYVGGIAGQIAAGTTATISDCINNGKISSEKSADTYIGGLVGQTSVATSIENCVNNGEVLAASGKFVGGFVGANTAKLTVSKSENKGNVTGATFVGGILGQNNYASATAENYCSIDSCVNSGAIEAKTDTAGGMVGLTARKFLKITNSTNKGAVTATNCAGGIMGRGYESDITIDNCVNYGAINATSQAAAIYGRAHTVASIGNYTVTATNCTNYGILTGSKTGIAIVENFTDTATGTVYTVTADTTGSADYSTTAWLLGYQVSDKYTNDDGVEVQDIRVVGIIDSLEYSAVGFEIVFKDADGNEISANKIDQDCEYVYKQLSGIGENDTTIDYDADEIRDGGYLFAIVIEGIPTSVGDLTFDVNTYAKAVDTTAKTYGEDGTATHTVGTTPAGDMEVKKN